jgi:hypothetical protein
MAATAMPCNRGHGPLLVRLGAGAHNEVQVLIRQMPTAGSRR